MTTSAELIEWGYGDWTARDFIRDARSRGYTLAQAKRFAAMYLFVLGKVTFTPPKLDGWKPLGRPMIKDGGLVAWLFGRGNKYVLVTERGERLTPPQLLAPAVFAADSLGWYGA